MIVVLVTTKDRKQAKAIASALLKARLIACANIVPQVESLFVWQGKAETAKEALLILKTTQKCFSRLEKTIKSIHSYQTPEIIALPIKAGSKDYLDWIKEAVCLK